MKMFLISLQKPGVICCGPQLSCGNVFHRLSDFVLFFWVVSWLMEFVYMGTQKVGLLASLTGGSPWKLSRTVAVARRSSCWKPHQKAEKFLKPFLMSIFKVSQGTGSAGSGRWSMTNDRTNPMLFSSGLPILPISAELPSLALQLLLTACNFGSNENFCSTTPVYFILLE